MGAQKQGADAVAGRWLTINRTLCFLTHGDDVLLLKRALTKRVFPGLYNGVGGHIEQDEDPLTGAIREIREETGLSVAQPTLRGVLHVDAGAETGIMVFVFSAEAPSREVVANDEGTLEWVPRAHIAELPLVEDVLALLPLVLDSDPCAPPFFAHSSYDARDQLILRFAGSQSLS